MSERDNDVIGVNDHDKHIDQDGDIVMRVREFIEIEKMRNLEISRFDDEVDQIHKSKDKRINALSEELWHSNRRADDLDRRWNELATAYERMKVDLENTGRRLDQIEHQASYRLLNKTLYLAQGGPLRTVLSKRRTTGGATE